jgi:branched-chain amino acid aminotransferase
MKFRPESIGECGRSVFSNAPLDGNAVAVSVQQKQKETGEKTMEIRIEKSTTIGQKTKPEDAKLGFGKLTTDHMFLLDYTVEKGWYDPRIVPYGPLDLDPCAMVLHYNQELFEGLKAYHLPDGGIGLFRPEMNIARMNRGAARLVMPEIPPDLYLEAIKQLVLLDRAWIPTSEGTSLYIRPTMIANEAALGVKPSDSYLFFIVIGPVGPYYPGGFNPTRIYVCDNYIRSAQGGAGDSKTSGNYAPTLLVAKEAAAKGYTQVLWLDAKEFKYVEEVGTSNIFFRIQDELITPPLEGTILPGVTRDSVIHLARHWGMKVTERKISIDEIIDAIASGSLKEMFATGTAAVISPVGEICFKGKDYTVAGGRIGDVSLRLYEELTGIQYGLREDPFGWSVRIA